MRELKLKDRRSSIEFEWLGDDLAIDAKNSDERVCVYLDSAQARQLFEYLNKKLSAAVADEREEEK
jgi:hypothetical protein